MFRNKVMSGALIRAEDYFQALRQRLSLSRELSRAFAIRCSGYRRLDDTRRSRSSG